METIKRKRGRPRAIDPVRPRKGKLSITLTVGDLTSQASGDSMLEALQSLEKPLKITTKGVVLLSNGTKERSIVYTPFQLKRMFFPMAQKILAKQFEYGMV